VAWWGDAGPGEAAGEKRAGNWGGKPPKAAEASEAFDAPLKPEAREMEREDATTQAGGVAGTRAPGKVAVVAAKGREKAEGAGAGVEKGNGRLEWVERATAQAAASTGAARWRATGMSGASG
jgi:hypothetical protein